MKIWIFNNYNMLPEQGGLNRHYYFAKYLKRTGHEPVVFVGSHPHNTSLQLIDGKEKFSVYQEEPFPWVLIKTCNYEGSKIKRVFSMFEYYFNAKNASKHFEKPDAIIGSSAHPLAALLAIKLGKKYGCKKIVEVRDLWPESIVIYGILKRNNPLIKLMYRFEKWLYTNADEIIFTMQGGYDYIKQQRWDTCIPKSKVHYLNNGIDLELFEQNKNKYQIEDDDLKDDSIFKVVYTGSIRRVNNLGILLDVAEKINAEECKIFIWGDGEERLSLEKEAQERGLKNIIFKGFISKNYIPFIVSHADLNLAHNEASEALKYGISFNKMFDYLAAGKPILFDFPCKYNFAVEEGAGVQVDNPTIENIACAITYMSRLKKERIEEYKKNATRVAQEYGFDNLTLKLINIIEK